jgi:precorrin-3B synthase
MSAHLTRGACPALSAPMQTGDGLLVRLSPAHGSLKPTELAGLAEAASRHGNGILEVTARGSLQIRGLETDTVQPLANDIEALGIAVRTGVPVETGPLAGLDPNEIADPRPLAEAIRTRIAATDLSERLGPKVSVVVDGGGALNLGAVIADVRLDAGWIEEGVAWQVGIGGTAETAVPISTVDAEQAGDAAVSILTMIAEMGRQGRARDLDAATVRALVTRAHREDGLSSQDVLPANTPPSALPGISPARGEIGLPPSPRPSCSIGDLRRLSRQPISPLAGEMSGRTEGGAKGRERETLRSPIGVFDLTNRRTALGVGLPFGQIEASRLAGFCRAAEEAGATEIRLAPGRAILLLGEPSACLALQAVAPRHGFIVDASDARLAIAACPGRPACASGHIAARAIAGELAALGSGLFNHSLAVHVSGCVKGCAHPGPADLTFVGHADGVDLVLGGKASGIADVRLEHAEIRHGFARLAGHREKRRSGESAGTCFSRLGATRVAAAFRGHS